MSPSIKPIPPAGDGRVEISDIRAKLEEIRGETAERTEAVKPKIMTLAIAGGVALVAVAFVLGRRRGRRKSTWVEIRRL